MSGRAFQRRSGRCSIAAPQSVNIATDCRSARAGTRPDMRQRGVRCTGDDARLIEAWGEWKRAHDQAEGTIYMQGRFLHRIAACHPLTTITSEELARWLSRQPWARETRRSAHQAVHGFFRWLRLNRYRDDDPSELLGTLKHADPCSRPTPANRLARALEQATMEERLMVLLAVRCGLRRAEIAGLSTDDVDGDWLYVLGKGKRRRKVPVRCPELAQMLAEWPEGPLFPGRFGGSVTPDYVGRRLSKLLGTGWTGHSLRHRFANDVHAGSKDILSLQLLLGHRSPETTRAYVATDDDALWAAAGWAA